MSKEATKSVELGHLFYNPVHGRITVAQVWKWQEGSNGRPPYQQNLVDAKTFRNRNAGCVIESFDEAFKKLKKNKYNVYLGTVERPHRFSGRLYKEEKAELHARLTKLKEKIRETGPVKVKDYTHYFSIPVKRGWDSRRETFDVSSFVPLKDFLAANPVFRQFKRHRSHVSSVWVPREELKPFMKIVKYSE